MVAVKNIAGNVYIAGILVGSNFSEKLSGAFDLGLFDL